MGNNKQADKTIKNKDGKLLIDDVQITKRWKEYLEELYDGENLENWEIMKEQTTMTILRSEYDTALSELKPKKAPGIDYIPVELLQNSSQIVKDALYDLTRDIYMKGEIPDDYCNSIIVSIPKKQNVNTCDQFRTLSLITLASKILTNIINRRK